MRITKKSPELGISGRILVKSPSALFEFDYCHKEILACITENQGLNKIRASALNQYIWQNIAIANCGKYMAEIEKLFHKETEPKIKSINRSQTKMRAVISGRARGENSAYYIIVNTADWNMQNRTPAAVKVADCCFRRNP